MKQGYENDCIYWLSLGYANGVILNLKNHKNLFYYTIKSVKILSVICCVSY